MNIYDFIQISVVFGFLVSLSPALGSFMADVFEGRKTFLSPILRPLERGVYRFCSVDEDSEMNWRSYATAVILFNAVGFLLLFLIQIFQGILPLNPLHLPGLSWHLAFNTAISFVTNTNWQAYSGETIMSYLTQMLGLTVQNFLSAGTGIVVLLALIRGLSRKETEKLGNFWVDLTRSVVYVLLPLSIIFTLILVSQGVIQNFSSAQKIVSVEGAEQSLPQGPAASQIAIKQIGTNGGGYFNANSAHPYENPTPISNILELIALLLLPSALCFTFGIMTGKRRQGVVLWVSMLCVLVLCLGISLWSEYLVNPIFHQGALMEGKETRFGVTNSVLWSVFTTAASNGSVNAMHSSLSPLSGGIALLNILLGEVIFGGVGSGLYGMILFAILSVFICGLMVGRTPEYLGKKIEARDIQMTMLAILGPCAVILLGAGISIVLPVALSSLSHQGPHGLSEMLYAFASAAGNNGSSFAGLNANTPYFNVVLGFAMLIGRFVVILPALAIAGNMARKKISPLSFGTFTTDNSLFAILLISVIFVVGVLTFFPAISLGPVVEHILMLQGKVL